MYGFVFYTTLFNLIYCFDVKVSLRQGIIIGTTKETIFDKRVYTAFYGVPYSQAPVGNLRFKNPKNVLISDYPYNLSTPFYTTCAQPHILHKPKLYGVEDCLYLNIYTPALPKRKDKEHEKKAVIVFYHGYAFTSSFSHVYGPDFLIDNDVLYITAAYRISVFGFLKRVANDTHGNMGLKDIVKSLKWIKANVKHFGGDDTKITVFGSGSAANYLSLLLMTKARHLFSKMILHSASILSPSIFQGNALQESEKFKLELDTRMKKKPMSASAKGIIEASLKIYSSKDITNLQRPIVPFTPMAEAKSKKSLLLESSVEYVKKNSYNNINKPILIGYNTLESLAEVLPFLHNPKLLNSFNTFFKFFVPYQDGCRYNYSSQQYLEVSSKIKRFYFKNYTITENSLDDFIKYTSDLQKYPVYKFIKTMLSKNKSLYAYKFNYQGGFNTMKNNAMGELNTKIKGAATGDELCYILKCEPMWEFYDKLEAQDNDTIFIKDISEMWANFAKTGDPTPDTYKGNIKWPLMTGENDKIMYISNEKRLSDTRVDSSMYQFWNELYDSYYSPTKCKQPRDEL